jgi:hypothetical protein
MSSEVHMAVTTEIVVLWVVIPCSLVASQAYAASILRP